VDGTALRRFARHGWGLAAAGLGLAAALAVVGWVDYAATRREFVALLRNQAASLRQTVAAAARGNRAAARDAEAGLRERLLDNARLLAELDRHGALTQVVVADVARRNRLFRVSVLGADGSRQFAAAPDSASHRGTGPGGQGGWGPGGPPWAPGGTGSGNIADKLLSGQAREAVSDVHEGRRAGAARIAAGVGRAGGGAILINVDAAEVMSLRRQSSLEELLGDIVRSTADVAYVVFEESGVRRTAGVSPPDSPSGIVPVLTERWLTVDGRPVLELVGPVGDEPAEPAVLRLGMRLDGLARAERQSLWRLGVTLSGAVLLGGLALGLVWLRRDYGALSERHARAQEALRRQDRLAAMGELASTVAHEVRNPLNAIAMSAQRLQREGLDGPPGEADRAESVELVGVITRESQRINRIVQQFLEFARPPTLAPHPTDLGPWLSSVADAVRPLAESRGLRLMADVGRAGRAHVDPDRLRQAVDNLLRNAIEATPAGGSVAVVAQSTAHGHAIEVRDGGPGIDAEHLPRIFDLYFTTKADGTGVGLAVTQQIVAAHDGTIEVDTAPGRGTTMRIRLPDVAEGSAHA